MGIDTNKQELTDGEKIDFIIEQSLLRTRTFMVAECVSFDSERNTVSVQPLIQTKVRGDSEPINLPIIQNVPVAFYGAGNVVITYKPEKGDTCELWINDRSIEQWKNKGGITDPQRARHHDMSDAVAYFGLNEYGKAYPDLKGGMDIRTRDGNTSLHLIDQNVEVQINNAPIMTLTSNEVAFTVPIKAPTGEFKDSLKIANKEVKEHVHGGVASGGSKTDPL